MRWGSLDGKARSIEAAPMVRERAGRAVEPSIPLGPIRAKEAAAARRGRNVVPLAEPLTSPGVMTDA